MSTGPDDEDNTEGAKQGADWLKDHLGPDLVMCHRVRRRLYEGRSRFQRIDVLETGSFGTCLVLDGRIQSCEGDEFIFHEALAQPPMVCHARPEHVLVAGGGEGATLRQVLMHASVAGAVMVDIDQEVIDVCRQRLPAWNAGSFEDPRTRLVIGDARRYVETCRDRFDVIILDLPESLEGGPAAMLYTQEFYSSVKAALRPGGIVAVQCDNASWGSMFGFPAIINTLRSVFAVVRPYQVHIPSFGGAWGFATASQDVDPSLVRAADVDSRLAERRMGGLSFYDGLSHEHMFSVPKHVRRRLESEHRLIRDSSPLAI